MTINLNKKEHRRILEALEPHYPDGIPEEIVLMLVEKYRKHCIDRAIWELVMLGDLTMRWAEDDWHLTLRSQL